MDKNKCRVKGCELNTKDSHHNVFCEKHHWAFNELNFQAKYDDNCEGD